MGKNPNSDVSPQRMTDALAAYEEAVKEFSANATEFLEHISLLTRAREAYERAILVSTQLRGILDRGDETLRNFMDQMQQAVNGELTNLSVDAEKPEAVKEEIVKAKAESASAASAGA